MCSGKGLTSVLTNQPGIQSGRYEYNHVLVQPENISGGNVSDHDIQEIIADDLIDDEYER